MWPSNMPFTMTHYFQHCGAHTGALLRDRQANLVLLHSIRESSSLRSLPCPCPNLCRASGKEDAIQRKIHKLCPQAGRKVVDKEAEEEQYRDLTLLMELLTNLLSKDFIDLSPADSGETVEEVIATNQGQYHGRFQCSTHHHKVVTAADVCLLGLNIIMPLMSAELLKFPNLCLQVEYFR